MFKRLLICFFILFALGGIFRGSIFRQLITYHPTGERGTYQLKNKDLIDLLDSASVQAALPSLPEIVKGALSFTGNALSFAATGTSNDPNVLMFSGRAHCVGYASFFTSICNFWLKHSNYEDEFIARHRVGQLHFLGIDIHKYFKSPFFKDHDFVTIEDRHTGEVIFTVDPTIYDYLAIKYVTLKE